MVLIVVVVVESFASVEVVSFAAVEVSLASLEASSSASCPHWSALVHAPASALSFVVASVLEVVFAPPFAVALVLEVVFAFAFAEGEHVVEVAFESFALLALAFDVPVAFFVVGEEFEPANFAEPSISGAVVDPLDVDCEAVGVLEEDGFELLDAWSGIESKVFAHLLLR